MTIRNFSPSKRIAILIHSVFGVLYSFLIIRAAISLYQDPVTFPNILDTTRDGQIILAIKRGAGIVYSPFWLILGYPTIGGEVVTTILFAIFGYALLHYGMFVQGPADRRISMANKILDFCRMVFFLAGTLLILLMVARMGVMLYHDFTIDRRMIGVPARR